MGGREVFPKQRALVVALTGAIAGVAPLAANADCVSGGTVAASTNGNINWSSGNCTINPSVTVSDFFQQTALRASSSVGTLTNSGTLTGFRYGLLNSGTISALTNNSAGLISGESVSGIGLLNNLNIGTLTNNGRITSGSTGMSNEGSIGTLINNGSIIGSGGFGYTRFVGLINFGTITELTNNNLISGGSTGIQNSGTIGTLTNNGQITASNGPDLFGVNNAGGTISVLNNTSTGSISSFIGINNSGAQSTP